MEEALKRLRELGWQVAVHNDYNLKDGSVRVYWMFTHINNGTFVDGDGATDEEALSECLREVLVGGST